MCKRHADEYKMQVQRTKYERPSLEASLSKEILIQRAENNNEGNNS